MYFWLPVHYSEQEELLQYTDSLSHTNDVTNHRYVTNDSRVYYIKSIMNLDKHTKKILKICGITDINNVPSLNKYFK